MSCVTKLNAGACVQTAVTVVLVLGTGPEGEAAEAAIESALEAEEEAATAEAGAEPIFKASQPGLGAQHFAEGYKPEDFPGSAFFTRDEDVAQHWAEIYGDGYIETRVPRQFFDENLLQYEGRYPGWPGKTEIEIPSNLLNQISSFPRVLH